MKKLEVKETLKKGADKTVTFIKNHQLWIGYCIGVATVVGGCSAYEKLFAKDEVTTDIFGVMGRGVVRLKMDRQYKIGKNMPYADVEWDAETAKEIGELFIEVANKVLVTKK